jgi:hypothetical protein
MAVGQRTLARTYLTRWSPHEYVLSRSGCSLLPSLESEVDLTLRRQPLLAHSSSQIGYLMAKHQPEPSPHRIHQSVVRWPFQDIPLDVFCKAAAEIGLEGIDVLYPEEYEVPERHGLHCTMAFAGLGDNKEIGMNRLEYHDRFEAALRQYGPLAQKAGITVLLRSLVRCFLI